MAIVVVTGCGKGGDQPVRTGPSLRVGDLVQRFRGETGEVLPGGHGVLCFCLDADGAKERKYGRFWLNVLPRDNLFWPENRLPVSPELENQLQYMLGEGESDDQGVRWRLEKEGWVAVKQYAANVVVVWQGGEEKGDARWKRLDAVLARITASP